MLTIDDVVGRVLRDWLTPPDDQPLRFTLASSLDSSVTTLAYDSSMLSPELEELLGPGVLVEIDMEQIFLGSVDVQGSQVTNLVRGANGTTPTSHDSGSLATLTPTFARQSVFDAVSDAIYSLHPPLFAVKGKQLTVETTFNEAPADLLYPLYFSFIGREGAPKETSVQWSSPFPESSTGKIVIIMATPGTLGHLNYVARFVRPTSPTDTLGSLNVKEEWTQLLTIAATYRLISSRDIEAATQEFLTRQLAHQGFPVPSGSRIRDGLITYYEYLKQKAHSDLQSEREMVIVQKFPMSKPSWLGV